MPPDKPPLTERSCNDELLSLLGEEKLDCLRKNVLSLFSRRGVPDPQEATQEVFKQLCNYLVNPVGQIETTIQKYTFGIAKHILIHEYKDKTKRREKEEEIDDGKLEILMMVSPNPEQVIAIKRCLNKLERSGLDLLISYYFTLRNDRETLARECGTTRPVLATRVNRLKSRLEECLNENKIVLP